MSTADTVLSINVKMSPGPDHRQEPVAPDKSNTENSRTEIGNDSVTESTILGTTEALVVQNINLEATGTRIETISEPTNGQGTTPNSGSDNKQVSSESLSARRRYRRIILRLLTFFFFYYFFFVGRRIKNLQL